MTAASGRITPDAAARLAVSIKGGLTLVAGNCGYMAGFMGQKGTIIVCGDTGDLVDRVGAQVGQFLRLEVAPDLLDRIEVWCVAGQWLHR